MPMTRTKTINDTEDLRMIPNTIGKRMEKKKANTAVPKVLSSLGSALSSTSIG
jgi:hypothetical protein